MKFILTLSGFFLQLLLALSVDNIEDDKFVEFVISAEGDYVGLDHKILYSPRDPQKRFIQDTDTCKLPSKIKDFLITCKSYPNRMICFQHCPFGFTFNEGISREMKCWHEENKWEPKTEFEPCKPFVDCTLTLHPGGSYKCVTQYLDKGNHCDVSCEKYEDKKPVPKKEYKCDLNGKWEPQLPRCVKAGTDLKLVPAPKGQKVHIFGKKQ